jgi:predicted nucleic acid-binding protein
MPNLVIDSGVAIKWFVTEPYTTEARHILDGYRQGDLTFLAPDLIYAEVGNIAWKKQQFQGLSAADAQQIVNEFQAVQFTITPNAHLLNDAYRLAVTHQRTVYDSLYIALSVLESCQFVTADERLFNAVRTNFPNIVWLAHWP